MMPSQRRVCLAMFVEVGGRRPCTIVSVQEEDHTFADVDEEASADAASMIRMLVCVD